MKRTILIILIAFSLLITAGTASAGGTFKLTDVNVDQFDGQLEITVNYDDTAGTLSMQLTKNTAGLTPKAIDIVAYNLPNAVMLPVADNTGVTWSPSLGSADGFGTFASKIARTGGGDEVGPGINTPLVFNLVTTPTLPFDIPLNAGGGESPDGCEGHRVAVHIMFYDEGVPDGTITSTWITSCGSGFYIQEVVPEFPTLALPIAAIIGLAFIFQRRKE